jgi:hypothetical protein
VLSIANGVALVDIHDYDENQAMRDLLLFSNGQPILPVEEVPKERIWAVTRSKIMERTQPLSRDDQDYTVTPSEVKRWVSACGGLDVDATCDVDGRNAVIGKFWSDTLHEVWDGHRVWCNPPFNSKNISIIQILEHFHQSRLRYPSTQALFFLPLFRNPAWVAQLSKMPYLRQVHTYVKGFPLFHAPDGARLKTRWRVGVYWSDKLVNNFQPSYEPKPPGNEVLTQVSTPEASRPRTIGFLNQILKSYAKDESVKGWIHQCQEQSRQYDRTLGLKMVGKWLWRVKEGHY